MDILFLLIPLSLVLVAAIGIVLFWAVNTGQFEYSSRQGQSIIEDNDQAAAPVSIPQQSFSEIPGRNTCA